VSAGIARGVFEKADNGLPDVREECQKKKKKKKKKKKEKKIAEGTCQEEKFLEVANHGESIDLTHRKGQEERTSTFIRNTLSPIDELNSVSLKPPAQSLRDEEKPGGREQPKREQVA